MKAISIEKAGGPEILKVSEIEKPSATENEVLIKVKAIGINPVDYKVRMIEAVLNMICGEGYPAILGWDVAGEVEAVGEGVTKFSAGDKVFGMVNFPGRAHAYAEYVISPADHIAKIPEGSSFETAAATTLAALTALQALNGNVKEGDRVLIQAGSGGVGHFAIQIAKNIGAYVISTSSAKNKDFVLSLGANEHIDYRENNFEDIIQDADFVLDGVGGDEMVGRCIKAVKNGGQIISLPSPDFSDEVKAQAEEKNIDLSFMLVSSNGADMETLAEYLNSGKIRAHVSDTFAFEDMSKAHEQIESGRTVGRIVVTV